MRGECKKLLCVTYHCNSSSRGEMSVWNWLATCYHDTCFTGKLDQQSNSALKNNNFNYALYLFTCIYVCDCSVCLLCFSLLTHQALPPTSSLSKFPLVAWDIMRKVQNQQCNKIYQQYLFTMYGNFIIGYLLSLLCNSVNWTMKENYRVSIFKFDVIEFCKHV